MKMRRILQCVFVLFVVVLAGWSDNGSRTNASQQKKAPQTKTANSNSNVPRSQSGQSQQPARSANNTNREAAQGSNSDAPANSNAPAQPDNGSQTGADQTTKGTGQAENQTTETWPGKLMDFVIRGLVIAGGVVILVLIGMGVQQLRKQSRQHLEHHLRKAAAAQALAMGEAQKEILDKLSSLSSAQKDANTRLYDVHTEIRTLARIVRESPSNRGDGRPYASIASSYSYNEPPPPKEEPEFPVSAVDYLDKMTRFSNVVKPDFQNGILINDPDGTGEFMLIRDSRLPDETQPLFVVPRHAQFQTKQDFYTYYEKYYDCMRPGAGDVWIIDPAVVEKVSGGWLLREKGVLEIR